MPKVLLTPAFIKNNLVCPEGKRRIEYCDTVVPGLYIEVRASSPGQGTSYLRYKDSISKTCHQKLGRTTEITLPEARRRAKDLKAEIQLGSDPRAEARKQKAVVTFEVFAKEHYLPYKKGRKRSYADDEKLLRLRLLPTFGKHPLNKITRQQIQKFHSGLKNENLAAATCDLYLRLLHHFFRLAIDWNMLEGSNPASRVPQFREDNKRERYLSEDELGRLMSVLQSHSSRTISLLITWQLSTGARINESLRAQHSDINLVTLQWRIPVSSSKSKKARTVPLNATAVSVLMELERFDGVAHLFVNPRTKKRYVNVNKTWWDIRTKAGLPDLQLHDLRHQFASMLVSQGGRTLYEVQSILGHSSPIVTQRYAHLSASSLNSAAETASDCLGNALRDFDAK